MIIDATHKRWFLTTASAAVAATLLYFWLDRITPGGLTGGSTVGLWYGLIGSLLMVYAGLLSALRKVPGWWWIGARKTWLRGHIWLGLLSAVFLLCHSHFRWGGPLEIALWLVTAATLLTGVFGLILQQLIPRLITTRITREAPYEEIAHLCTLIRGKADSTLSAIWSQDVQETQQSFMASQTGLGAKMQLQEFYDKQLRPFLAERYQRAAPLASPMRASASFSYLRSLPGLAKYTDKLEELESLCEERRQLGEQEWWHHWLHGWMLLHIPFSVALLVLGLLHVVTALYY